MTNLTFFDLDHTLLAGDSDYLFGEYLAKHNYLNAKEQSQMNLKFYKDYQAQQLDIDEFLKFALRIFDLYHQDTLNQVRHNFIQEKIQPLIYKQGQELIAKHQKQGDRIIITTATNCFIVSPIAKLMGIKDIICTEIAQENGSYTSQYIGLPNYAVNKVTNIQRWLAKNQLNSLIGSTAYSDSINDLPLLNLVDNAVAVNADAKLTAIANEKNWQQLNFQC